MVSNSLRSALLLASVCLVTVPFQAMAGDTPTPMSVLGNNPGDDRYLANYEDSVKYFRQLAASSDRIKLFSAGKTTQGREMIYSVISSPENLKNFDKWTKVSKRLADPRGLSDQQAQDLAKDSKIIVHIDGGMHSSEVADHQLPIALAYKLLSAKNDAEVDAILDNVILVLWPTLNPDGQDQIVDWYRKNLGTEYETSDMPWLYQEYVGHDNNRDGYMQNMKESQIITRTGDSYSPVIWYTHHQPAPFPARMWTPAFADPISSNVSPYMRQWTSTIGANMLARFEKEQKPGAISQALYDNWYPGYLDYTRVFRNTIAFYTEAAHQSATPKVYKVEDFPKNMQDLKAQVMYPHPWKGGLWRLRDTVDYMMTASMSVLETAVKNRETLLYNRYQAGRDAVKQYSTEGPFAYVVSPAQVDKNEADILMQKMIDNGLEVHRAKAEVKLADTIYPAGSLIILMDQPFAGLAKELFEEQKYPDAITDGQGSPLELPYDVTGWTLSMQMNVKIDTIKSAVPDDVRGKLEQVSEVKSPAGKITGNGSTFVLSHKVNASFQVMNEVLAKHGTVAYANEPVETDKGVELGAIVVSGIDRSTLEAILAAKNVNATALDTPPAMDNVGAAKIGLYRPWGSNIDEGWTRWLLEQYGFGPTSVYDKDVREGDLRARFDTIVIPDISGRRARPAGQRAGKDLTPPKRATPLGTLVDGISAHDVPDEYANGIGAQGSEELKKFVMQGGTLVTLNNSSDAIIDLFELPVTNVLKDVKSDVFLCTGALLEVNVKDGTPSSLGMQNNPIVMFEKGPAFATKAKFKGQIIATYADTGNPLRSGVLLHPEAIAGKAAALKVDYGRGHIYMFGFKPQWRAQAHGTYKFLFNTLYNYTPTKSTNL